jgi:hypothetical protein
MTRHDNGIQFAMAENESHLQQAERHVREGALRIADMESRIDELERDGHANAAALAKQLLQTLEKTQELAIEHLNIERQHAHKE